jgi:hypothetical protein
MSGSHTQPSELLKLVPEGSVPNERRRKPAMLHRQSIPSVTTHVHGDSVTKMWSAYLVEAEKHDQRISDGWRDDANGVLIFVRPGPLIPYNRPIDKFKRPGCSQQPSEPSSLKATKSYPRTPVTKRRSFSDRSHSNSPVLPVTNSSSQWPFHRHLLLHPLFWSTACGC